MSESRITVVKVGGREIDTSGPIGRLASWVASATLRAERLVLVHGGGEEVTERASALGLPTEKREGLRVTSAPMLEVVVEVLAGRVNARLVARLNEAGVAAVGLTGLSGRLLGVRPAGSPPGSLGFVGDPVRVRPALLEHLTAQGLVPVVAPLGSDASGQVYNVNADLAASALARALRANLYLVTDTPGVLGASGEVLTRLAPTDVRRLIARGIAHSGMIPKLQAAERAVQAGGSAWIGDLNGLLESPDTNGTWLRPPAIGAPRPRSASRGTRRHP